MSLARGGRFVRIVVSLNTTRVLNYFGNRSRKNQIIYFYEYHRDVRIVNCDDCFTHSSTVLVDDDEKHEVF